MDASKRAGAPKGRKRPDLGSADGTPVAVSAQRSDFTLKKAVFEITIVAVGVLLALIVDEARQSRADRNLADEARAAMREEIDQNRIRLATKLTLLHEANRVIEQNPAAGPRLVAQESNFQIAMTDAAWTMAVQTGALRFLDHEERRTLAYVYSSQDIYNRLLAEEMNHWTALAAAEPDDTAVKLWKAYARRVAVSVCLASIRIERVRNPDLPSERLQRVCRRYQFSTPPAALFKSLGLPMPNTGWRPGDDY